MNAARYIGNGALEVVDTEAPQPSVTKRRHWDIYNALRDRDAKRAAAADLIHLSEGEQWLRQLMQAEDALTVLATVPPDTELSGNGDEDAGTTR